MSEENMEIVRRVMNGWNCQDVERILALADIPRSIRERKPA
jgi:hypothetical protein